MKLVKVDLLATGVFRKAVSYDIQLGNVVFLVGDGNVLIKMVVEEVLNPSDDYKAFVFDGCRYGLHDLWALIQPSEYLRQLHEVHDKLNQVRHILLSDEF